MSATALRIPREEPERRDLLSWITTTDHKRIGILYLLTSLGYFGVAGALSLVIRTQLSRPNNTLVSAHQYAQLFTLHGTAMIFLFVAPFAFGLGNFLIPSLRRAHRIPRCRDERRGRRIGLGRLSAALGDSR